MGSQVTEIIQVRSKLRISSSPALCATKAPLSSDPNHLGFCLLESCDATVLWGYLSQCFISLQVAFLCMCVCFPVVIFVSEYSQQLPISVDNCYPFLLLHQWRTWFCDLSSHLFCNYKVWCFKQKPECER